MLQRDSAMISDSETLQFKRSAVFLSFFHFAHQPIHLNSFARDRTNNIVALFVGHKSRKPSDNSNHTADTTYAIKQ